LLDYPTLLEALAMHEVLLEEFGGLGGIRDLGALDAALMRPQLGYYDTLIEQAAAMMESLANNHPFVDGNKRVAFFITDTFLRLNGHFIDCDGPAAHAFFIGLFTEGEFRYHRLLPWLEEHLRRL
jgi:death on curing protein